MNNPQQEELLKQLRATIFSGNDFSDAIIRQLTGRHKGIDVAKAIETAKNQMKPAPLPAVGFDKIVKLHESRKRIVSLLGAHPEYLLNELPNNKSEKPFELLSTAYEKKNFDKDKIAAYVKHLESRARSQETKDQKDRLFETVREFAGWCRMFLLSDGYEPLYPLLTRQYEEIVSKIAGSVSKIGMNIITYRDLAEECYQKTKDPNGFQRILALINLRCADLKIPVPVVKPSSVCPACGDREQAGNICTRCHAFVKCFGCDDTIVKDAKICGGCGVGIANIKTWIENIENAEEKLSAGDYEAAENCIKEVKTKWGKHERIISIANNIAELQKKVAEYEKQIDENIAKPCYFSAQRSIDAMKREKIKLPQRIAAKETAIREQIATAEKLKNLNLRVTGLTASVNGFTVQLKWNVPICNDLTLKYIVYREKTEIARTSANSYVDTIEAGTPYFYSVQIEYAVSAKIGVISGVWEAVKSHEEMIVPAEVTNIAKTGGDRMVSISFKAHPNAAEVKIERTDKKFPDNYVKGTFLDTDVANDVAYSYRIISLYRTLSKGVVASGGVQVSVTPAVPPLPAEWITAESITEHFTEVAWKKPPKGTVAIYICEKPLNIPVGLVDKTTINGKYINAGQAEKAQIPHDFHGVRYLYAVTAHNNSCVIGKPKIIKHLRKLRNVDFNRTERRIEVSWARDVEIQHVAVFTKADDAPERREIIPNAGKHTVVAPQGAKTFSVAAASYWKTEDNIEYFSEKEQKLFVLQPARLNFADASGGGLFSKTEYKITIQSNTPLPCDLHVLTGEGRTPIDAGNYAPTLVISQKDFTAGDKPVVYSLKYTRNDKSKPLIFRIIPAEKAYYNSVVISPETRQIK